MTVNGERLILRALLWIVRILIFKWLAKEHWKSMADSLHEESRKLTTDIDNWLSKNRSAD